MPDHASRDIEGAEHLAALDAEDDRPTLADEAEDEEPRHHWDAMTAAERANAYTMLEHLQRRAAR